MSSKIDICNLALKEFNANAITSLDQNSNEAKLCNTFYEQNFKAVLELYPWQSVVKRTELSRLTTTPAYGWSYQFALPADFVRLIDTYPEMDHEIESGNLLCDSESVNIQYIRYNTDLSKFSPSLIDLIAMKLASRIAYPLTADHDLVKWLEQRAETIYMQAKSLDAKQQRLLEKRAFDRINKSKWLEARN